MSTYRPSHLRFRSGRTASGIRAGASGVFAAATAIGLLTFPVPAQAAPACAEYKFNGDFSLNQTNGWFVAFTSYGPVAGGRAVAVKGGDKMTGNVTGGIQGRNVDFTIQWEGAMPLGFDGRPRGHYTGTVGDDGLVRNGFTSNETAVDFAEWDSIGRLECVAAPAPPPNVPPQQLPQEKKKPPGQIPWPEKPATPPAPVTPSVNVVTDTDVFDKPSHEGGKVILDVNGQRLFLDAGVDQVKLVGGCTKQTWCTVTNPRIPRPNNTGAVWGGHLEV
jgi:hypothetical protein